MEQIPHSEISAEQRAREMTEARIRGYREAAKGFHKIHRWLFDGNLVKEIAEFPGNEVDIKAETQTLSLCFGEQGIVTYDDVMPPEEATRLADDLQAQIDG